MNNLPPLLTAFPGLERKMTYSLSELCICAAAEAFRGEGETMITSIGLVPRLAASLAKSTFAPGLMMTEGEAYLVSGTRASGPAWRPSAEDRRAHDLRARLRHHLPGSAPCHGDAGAGGPVRPDEHLGDRRLRQAESRVAGRARLSRQHRQQRQLHVRSESRHPHLRCR